MSHKASHPHLACQVCGRHLPRSELVPSALVRPALAQRIASDLPAWTGDSYICRDDLNRFRRLYVESAIADERGEISALQRSVIDSLTKHELLSSDTETEFGQTLTSGERLADRVATFGGSWAFIGMFGAVLVVWMIVNSLVLMGRAFDPFPYILLNLVLSCLAAIQAPVIMMSQNRQEARDRLRAQNDYRVNLKAELEIRQLHEKLDHLLDRQWERFLEIQEIQIEILEELTARRAGRPGGELTR
jgi:uncharacterized membrane protein